MGERLNPRWDGELALRRVRRAGLELAARAGALSGGQRAQLALTVAAAKRPELLILYEPAAALDPLARDDFLSDLGTDDQRWTGWCAAGLGGVPARPGESGAVQCPTWCARIWCRRAPWRRRSPRR
jgi:hypothetical protein